MSKQFLYLLMGTIILVVTLWWTRYQVVQAPAPEGLGFYRIDRFTGKAEFVTFSKTRLADFKLTVVVEE